MTWKCTHQTITRLTLMLSKQGTCSFLMHASAVFNSSHPVCGPVWMELLIYSENVTMWGHHEQSTGNRTHWVQEVVMMGEERSPAVQCRYFCRTPRLSPQAAPANPSSGPLLASSFYTLPAASGSPLSTHAPSVAEMIGRQSENC